MNRFINVAGFAALLAVTPLTLLADPAKKALTLHAEVAPRAVSLAGQIEVSAVLTNTDDRRQVVLRGEPGWTAAGGFSIEVTDASGNRRATKPEEGGITLEVASTGSRRFLLTPGFAYGTSRVMDAKDLFSSPGTYTLRVIYQAPKPGNGQGNGNALEGETASAEPVTVTVRG